MADIIELLLTNQQARNLALGILQSLTGSGKARDHEDRLKSVEEQMARVRALAVAPAPVPALMTPPSPGPRPAALDSIRTQLVDISARLKEAGRFAHEDGMGHPEVQKRLGDSEAILSRLERYDLAPENVLSLSPGDREALQGELTRIRRLRQRVYNSMGTADDLDQAAADAGESAKRLRLAAAGISPDRERTVIRVEAPQNPQEPPREAETPYSSYAPEMDVDTGCLPCGKAHLGTVDALLREAAEAASGEGMTSPEVQDRLSVAEEEIMALFADDWTAERIAKSPEGDRRILEEYGPRVQEIGARLSSVRSPEELQAVAVEMSDLRERFRVDLQKGAAEDVR